MAYLRSAACAPCSDAGVLRVVGPRQLAGVPCVFGGGQQFGGTLGIGGSRITQVKGGKTPAASASLRDSVQVGSKEINKVGRGGIKDMCVAEGMR